MGEVTNLDCLSVNNNEYFFGLRMVNIFQATNKYTNEILFKKKTKN